MESIYIVHGNDQGMRITLGSSEYTIGRDPHNRITVHDQEVSRFHAVLLPTEGGRQLRDLKSSNGIFLNGKQVKDQILHNGDQFQIGQTLFLYSFIPDTNNEYSSIGSVDLQEEEKIPPQEHSRIVHSLGIDDGEKFFQSSAAKSTESDWLQRTKAHLNLMYHTTLVVSQTLDIDQLLHRILDLIFEWVKVDRGCIFLRDPESNALNPKVYRAKPAANGNQAEMKISRTIFDYVLKNNEGVLTSDAQTDLRWDTAASIVQMGVREAICVPMNGRYGLVGMIYIDTARGALENLKQEETIKQKRDPIPESQTNPGIPSDPQAANKKLTPDHLKLMITIGHQAALAVEDTQYYMSMMQGERLAAVGQTVAALSHHIKNILQGIRGGSYLIDHGLKNHNEETIVKGWNIVEKNQNRISDLILDMLTFSKERIPIFEEHDINQVVFDVVELMQARCIDQNVRIEYLPMNGIPPAYFDSEQINRAITNLVSNAIDAALSNLKSPDDDSASADLPVQDPDNPDLILLKGKQEKREIGLVQVKTQFYESESSIAITVDDSGTGIAKEDRDILFHPFYSKNKSSGTGIGLAVTNKIVQEHHGTLEVEDSFLGGARFVLTLPFVSQKPKTEEQ
ncbi:MAG: FHA domain-containing protein [Planctomycetia bacterium]|nr:FHA domain-containing protein [Planctomycetia bacterium]